MNRTLDSAAFALCWKLAAFIMISACIAAIIDLDRITVTEEDLLIIAPYTVEKPMIMKRFNLIENRIKVLEEKEVPND